MGDVLGKGGPDNVTTTTNTSPWYRQQPFLRDLFSRSDQLYNDPNVGQIAPFTPDQRQAFDMTRQRALAGSPAQQAATDQIAATARGDFVGANPYLDAAFDRGASRVGDQFVDAVNRTSGAFSRGGRFGSGAYAEARNDIDQSLGDALGGLATNLYGGAYRDERENALRAASLGPSVAAGDYVDIQALGGIGGQQQAQAQSILDNPYRRLAQFQGGISGNYGGTSQSQQPVFQDPKSGLLGAATIASAFF
tara:strand:- start:1071 stop:1820 length:750 start_codon:yes stop_codon:yes gene_type:complete